MKIWELERRVKAYMALENEVKSPAGLAAFLGIGTGELEDMSRGGGRRAVMLRCAMARMENELIANALRGKYNPTMSAFLLKCGFGYREKRDAPAQEQPQTLRVELEEKLDRLAK